MDNKSDSPEKQESERDKTGKFKPGFSGNPNGRPKKGQILSDILRQMLEEQPQGGRFVRIARDYGQARRKTVTTSNQRAGRQDRRIPAYLQARKG